MAWSLADQPTLADKNLLVCVVHDMAASASEPLVLGPQESLRVLFVFAEARGSSPLAARRERRELQTLFEDHKGESDVHLVVQTSAGPTKLRFGAKYKVQQSPNLRYDIEQLLGADALAA